MPALRELTQQLSSIELLQPITAVEPIMSGFSSLSYKVSTNKTLFFVKQFATDLADNNHHRHILKAAAEAELAPKVMFENENFVVQQYISGNTLDKPQFNLQQQVLCSMSLMAQCHQLSINAKLLDAEHSLMACFNHCDINERQQSKLLFLIEHFGKKIRVEKAKLCHGDLRFANVIIDKRAWLLDFEHSVLADIEYDIAMFVAINLLDPSQLAYFIHLYQQQTKFTIAVDIQKVMLYLGYCYLLNGLWFYRLASEQEGDFFRELALEQFAELERHLALNYSLVNVMRS